MLTVGDRLPGFKLKATVKRVAGEEFADAKRLGQVIISASIEGSHLVLFSATR